MAEHSEQSHQPDLQVSLISEWLQANEKIETMSEGEKRDAFIHARDELYKLLWNIPDLPSLVAFYNDVTGRLNEDHPFNRWNREEVERFPERLHRDINWNYLSIEQAACYKRTIDFASNRLSEN